jgi:ZIP family zinc transporter/zinc and cadmium transporter
VTAFSYACFAALANVVGAAAVTSRRAWSTRSLELLIAFSAGFMLSVAFADIIPEAILRGGERAALVALAGFVLVHLTQHAMVKHFHFGEETHPVASRVGVSALAGLLLHTFVDGVAIASAFAVSTRLGVLVFGAVFLHKFPEGLAISSLTLAAGGSRRAALGSAALLGGATLVGVLLTGEIAPLAQWGLALSGGVTLYVGASNLVPEFQGKAGWWHNLAFFAGVAAYLVARSVAPPG